MFESKDKKFFDSRIFYIFTLIRHVFIGLNEDLIQINLIKFLKTNVFIMIDFLLFLKRQKIF